MPVTRSHRPHPAQPRRPGGPARPGRLLAGVRLAWGVALLAAPEDLLRPVAPSGVDHTAASVARVLGGRHALQALVELAAWPRWRAAGSVVDGLHAITAVALAVGDPRWRRAALADAIVAGSFALAPWFG